MNGSVMDLFILPGVIFVIAVCAVVGYLAYSTVMTQFAAHNQTQEAAEMVTAGMDNVFPSGVDLIVPGVLVGTVIMIIVLALLIPSHPIFMFAGIILLVVLLVAAPIMSNSFMELFQSDQLVAYSNAMPMTMFITGNLPYILLGVGFFLIIILYAKGFGGQGREGV